MSAINNGGPAFPVSTRPMETEPGFGHQSGHSTFQYGGMTLRDYFAAKAMHAALVTNESVADLDKIIEKAAEVSYQVADAMLAARQPKQEGCQNCGDTGIHACTGKPIDPMTGEKKEELSKVLEKVTGRDADGWIEWNGGECPVSNETIVDVRFRYGERGARVAADAWRWEHYGEGREYDDCDIIAYRVVKEGAKK